MKNKLCAHASEYVMTMSNMYNAVSKSWNGAFKFEFHFEQRSNAKFRLRLSMTDSCPLWMLQKNLQNLN